VGFFSGIKDKDLTPRVVTVSIFAFLSITGYNAVEMFSGNIVQHIRADFIKKYRNRPCGSPFWSFLAHFDYNVQDIRQSIKAGYYRMDYCTLWKPPLGSETVAVRTFNDRFVIRLLAEYLKNRISPALSNNYYSKGGKGRQLAFKTLLQNLPRYKYVYKTDAKSYFASIDRRILLSQVELFIKDPCILNLVTQAISPLITSATGLQTTSQGIPLRSSLSPILAELYLLELDNAFDSDKNIYYQRFCDDIITLAKTKWQQKRAVRKFKKILSRYKLTTRYQKTFAGKTSDLIAYLGYKLCPDGSIGLRLKEQGSSYTKIRSYLRRWESAQRQEFHPPIGVRKFRVEGLTPKAYAKPPLR